MKAHAFYFGGVIKNYFGQVFTPDSVRSSYGILVCKPLGQEDIRSNKAVTQLCREICGKGVITMTFDYYGTGDSQGKFEDVTLESCRKSIFDSAKFLRSNCNVKNIVVLMMRGGSLFLNDVIRIVNPQAVILWHPVIDGELYWNQLKTQHRSWLLGSFVKSDGKFKQGVELLGFLYSDRVKKEIRGVNLDLGELTKDTPCLLVSDNYDVEKKKMTSASNVEFIQSKHLNFWVKIGGDDPLVPIQDIKSISNWILKIDELVVNVLA